MYKNSPLRTRRASQIGVARPPRSAERIARLPHRTWVFSGLVFALSVVCLATVFAEGNPANEYGWRKLPTDAEIDQAAKDVVTYLSKITDDSDKLFNVERHFFSEVTDVRIVKMHKPALNGARDAVDASMAWLLYTSTFVRVVNGKATRNEPQFYAELLFYEENKRNVGFRPVTTNGWYFSDGIQRNSQEERDRYVQGWFDGFHFLPGFGWEHGPATGPSESGDSGWKTAVGVGAAGAAAVAAAAKVIASIFNRGNGRKKNAKDKNQDPDEPIGYVLQLSTEQIDLSSGTPQPLKVTAWAVDAKGGYRPAPRASITVTPSGAVASAVSASPASGTGTLSCKVSMGQGSDLIPEGEGTLEVTVSAPGGKSGAARVRIICAAQPVMEFF